LENKSEKKTLNRFRETFKEEKSMVRIRRGKLRNPASRQISESCTGFKPEGADEESQRSHQDIKVIGVLPRQKRGIL
jgi:hypothetical protein